MKPDAWITEELAEARSSWSAPALRRLRGADEIHQNIGNGSDGAIISEHS